MTGTIEIAETSFATTKIILLGAPGVGKSSIAQALRTTYRTTSAFDKIGQAELLTVHVPAGIRRETFVWELGLPDPLLTRFHLYDTDIVLVLFDVQKSRTSLAELQEYWNAVTSGLERGVRSVWVGVSRGTARDEELTLELRNRIGNQPIDYWFVDVADQTQSDELIERLKLEISGISFRREVNIGTFDIVENHILTLKQQGSTFYSEFNTLLRSLNKDRKFSERQLRHCLWHLDRTGEIRMLRSSLNEGVAWLQPANVNRLLAMIIHEARTNRTAPGRIQESRVIDLILAYRYFGEPHSEAAQMLLDCTANLLADRKLCFRETSELVFPDLTRRREPQSEPTYYEQRSAFDRLLAWLNPDRDLAAKRYEQIRSGLIRMFSAGGMPDAEGLADETFDRITQKINEIASGYVGDPARYFLSVGRNLLREHARRSLSLPIAPLSESQIYERFDSNLESEHDCLDKCLNGLLIKDREFILAYYAETKRRRIGSRRKLAEELGISQNAVRLKAYKIRSQLHKCIHNCLDEKARRFDVSPPA